jgi:hypothetical protein
MHILIARELFPAGTVKPGQSDGPNCPNSSVRIPQELPYAGRWQSSPLAVIDDITVLEKANSSGTVADPKASVGSREECSYISLWKSLSKLRFILLKAHTIKPEEAIGSSEPQKTICGLHQCMDSSWYPIFGSPTGVIKLVDLSIPVDREHWST